MSNVHVLSFLRRQPSSRDWNQQELAEFYRVESVLLQSGISVTTDRGISDEGDPWFVFCRADNEEVIAHFARINQEYVIVSNLAPGIARGSDFRLLIRRIIESNPLMLPLKRSQGQKIFVHPATLLMAMLASAYFLAGDKEATSSGQSQSDAKSSPINSLFTHNLAVVAAASLAAVWFGDHADSIFKFLENTLLDQGKMPSGEAAAHAPQSGHDILAFDPALAPAVRELEIGAHRTDATGGNAAETLASDGTGTPALIPLANSPAVAPVHVPSDNPSKWTYAPSPSVNNDDAATGHSQVIVNDPETAVSQGMASSGAPVKPVAPASPDPSPPSASPSSGSSSDMIAQTSEAALQFASSGTASPSIQPVVLSSAAVPLTLALEQVSAQVGFSFGPSAATEGTVAATTPVSGGTGTPSAATAGGAPPDPTQDGVSSGMADGTASSTGTTPAVVPSINQILHTVEAFLAHTPSFEVAVSGSNIVIVDTKASDASLANFGVLTWDLTNGSTLSIVGIIPHHHAAATA